MATKEELLKQLAALKEEEEKLSPKEPTEEEKLQAQIEALKLSNLNKQRLRDAEGALGVLGVDFVTIDTPRGIVVLKKAENSRMRQFMDLPKPTTTTCETLVMACVHPREFKEQADQIFSEYPVLLVHAADALVDLSKGAAKETAGK